MSEIPGSGGLFTALKEVVATLVSSGRTRLLLLGNELEEEKLRLIEQAILALAMVFCLCAGALVAVFFVTALFWEQRLVVLGIATGAFFVAGFVFLARLRQSTQRREPMFAASMAELQEDLRQLKSMAGHESAAE